MSLLVAECLAGCVPPPPGPEDQTMPGGPSATLGPPMGTLELSGGGVAIGIGYSWASGTLFYDGRSYPISVSGLSVGDVGVSNSSARGTVYHLYRAADFPGVYAAAKVGATIGFGVGSTLLRNRSGVQIAMDSSQIGLRFTAAADGVTIGFR